MTAEQVVAAFVTRLKVGEWPLRGERDLRRRVELYSAFRDTERDVLKDRTPDWKSGRTLYCDPLAEKIANAFADLLFGEDAVVEPAVESDGDLMDDLIQANDLPAELWRAERLCISESEVFWRAYRDPDVPHPLVSWHSRLDVVPLFSGRLMVGIAFVSRLGPTGNDEDGDRQTGAEGQVAWRHFELHTFGRVDNLLYRGTGSTIGEARSLEAHVETAGLPPTWIHELPGMLAGRISNLVGRSMRVAQSQYHGVRDLLFSLNEAATIGHENMRLVMKQRLVLPASAVGSAPVQTTGPGQLPKEGPPVAGPGEFDAGEDVLIMDAMDAELGKEGSKPAVLEYSFDATALVTWQTHLSKVILTRTDVAPQLVGFDDGFAGESGTALRTRMLNSVNAAEGKGRAWAHGSGSVPSMLTLLALLEQKPAGDSGYGRNWTDPATEPSFERATVLPEDPSDEVDRHARAVESHIESRQTAIEEQHPDWDAERVQEELKRIRRDVSDSTPTFTPPIGPSPLNGDASGGGAPSGEGDVPIAADQAG